MEDIFKGSLVAIAYYSLQHMLQMHTVLVIVAVHLVMARMAYMVRPKPPVMTARCQCNVAKGGCNLPSWTRFTDNSCHHALVFGIIGVSQGQLAFRAPCKQELDHLRCDSARVHSSSGYKRGCLVHEVLSCVGRSYLTYPYVGRRCLPVSLLSHAYWSPSELDIHKNPKPLPGRYCGRSLDM